MEFGWGLDEKMKRAHLTGERDAAGDETSTRMERTLETGKEKKSKKNIQNVFDYDGDQSLTNSILWVFLSYGLIPSCDH